jgi:hypothetical protein
MACTVKNFHHFPSIFAICFHSHVISYTAIHNLTLRQRQVVHERCLQNEKDAVNFLYVIIVPWCVWKRLMFAILNYSFVCRLNYESSGMEKDGRKIKRREIFMIMKNYCHSATIVQDVVGREKEKYFRQK